MLTVEALKIRYGEVEAVRHVDLAVDRGEIIALVGANGAGKSSTLGAISGLVPAAGGKVTFDGNDITGHPERQRDQAAAGQAEAYEKPCGSAHWWTP